jgi:hypothetical protein
MKLKVYGGAFDGTNRIIVAAKSWKEAHRAFTDAGVRLSLYALKMYGTITSNPIEVDLATSKPGVVFTALSTARVRAEDYRELRG